jgi:hypothetical protein
MCQRQGKELAFPLRTCDLSGHYSLNVEDKPTVIHSVTFTGKAYRGESSGQRKAGKAWPAASQKSALRPGPYSLKAADFQGLAEYCLAVLLCGSLQQLVCLDCPMRTAELKAAAPACGASPAMCCQVHHLLNAGISIPPSIPPCIARPGVTHLLHDLLVLLWVDLPGAQDSMLSRWGGMHDTLTSTRPHSKWHSTRGTD